MSRSERLHARFVLIQQSIAELHGEDLAFAAASAAWLQAIQYGARQSMEKIRDFTGLDPVAHAAAGERIPLLNIEHEVMLSGYHRELCRFLDVDPVQALRLSKSFEQVTRDICLQGG